MTFEYQKYRLPLRRRYQAAGLTIKGKPRRNQRRPELRGLKGRDYQQGYMQLIRKEKEASCS